MDDKIQTVRDLREWLEGNKETLKNIRPELNEKIQFKNNKNNTQPKDLNDFVASHNRSFEMLITNAMTGLDQIAFNKLMRMLDPKYLGEILSDIGAPVDTAFERNMNPEIGPITAQGKNADIEIHRSLEFNLPNPALSSESQKKNDKGPDTRQTPRPK